MEFLRDANVTDTYGQTAYDAWVGAGKSAPVAMDAAVLNFASGNPADLNNDGFVNASDISILLSNWGGSGIGDIDNSGTVDAGDLATLLGAWG